MYFCEDCGRDHTNPVCPRCGRPNSNRRAHEEDDVPQRDRGGLSVPDATLDHMIEQASIPTLASLLKKGIESGLIKPTHDYSAGNTPRP